MDNQLLQNTTSVDANSVSAFANRLENNRLKLGSINDKVVRLLAKMSESKKSDPLETKQSKIEDEQEILISPEEVKKILTSQRSFSRDYYQNIQKWKGYVLEVHEHAFTARLDDLNDLSTHEIASFSNDDVSPSDRPLISVGSVFYWSVGNYISANGQLTKQSLIRFQRLAGWSTSEVDRITDKARQLAEDLNWE